MINTLSTTNGYPVFQPNQVLKDSDLNSLFNYLDHQNRMTRVFTIGMGIICGLEPSMGEEASGAVYIDISTGLGLTSEGFLIKVPQEGVAESIRLTHFEEIPFSNLDLFQGNANNVTSGNAWELFFSEDPANESVVPLPLNDGQVDYSNKVLIISCDIEEEARDSCLIDCDTNGIDRELKLRFFLVDKSLNDPEFDADSLIYDMYDLSVDLPVENLAETIHSWYEVEDLAVLRFGYNDSNVSVDLSRITDFGPFVANYTAVIQQAITDIESQFGQFNLLFEPFFRRIGFQIADPLQSASALAAALNAKLEEILASTNAASGDGNIPYYGLQYFYDYIVQICLAFNEFRDSLFDLMNDCPPKSDRFPKYLLLGCLEDTTEKCGPPSIYRHYYAQAPVYNGNRDRLAELKCQYKRLTILTDIQNFCFLPFYQTPLKISPARDRQYPLALQAIPFFYSYSSIYRYWNFDACRKGKAHLIPSYYLDGRLVESVAAIRGQHLKHRFDSANFYQVEGHIGHSLDDAFEALEQYKKTYNLAFDVVPLRLGDQEADASQQLIGSFEDLDQEFEEMKDELRKKWEKELNEDWDNPQNPILAKMKENFFGKDSLADVNVDLMENRLLNLAQDPQNYAFQDGDANVSELLLGANGVAVGLVERGNPDITVNDRMRFFLDPNDPNHSQHRSEIVNTYAACLEIRNVFLKIFAERTENSKSTIYWFYLEDGEEVLENLLDETPGRPTGPISGTRILRVQDQTNFNIESLIETYQDFDALFAFLRVDPNNPNEIDGLTYNDNGFPVNENGEIGVRFEHGLGEDANCIPFFEFKSLLKRYLDRLERINEMRAFHNYACLHPGMEHLGGVPKGGTLILVYTGDQDRIAEIIAGDLSLITDSESKADSLAGENVFFPEKRFSELIDEGANTSLDDIINTNRRNKNVVIADFCLPYQCCGEGGGVDFVMAQPKPFVQLPNTVFCEDDVEEYPFILDPPGGLLKGDGITEEGGQYAFQPSSVDKLKFDPDQNGEKEPITITFTYVVNGVGTNFTISVFPVETVTLETVNALDFYCLPDSNNIGFVFTPPGGTMELSTDGETSYSPVSLNANNEYDLSTANLPTGVNSDTWFFRYSLDENAGQCGSTPGTVPIRVIRRPIPSFTTPTPEQQNDTDLVYDPDTLVNGVCTLVGRRIRVTNTSSPAADQYRWLVNGTELPSEDPNSSDLLLTFPFFRNTNGVSTYEIQLEAMNQDELGNNCSELSLAQTLVLAPIVPNWEFEGGLQSQTIDKEGVSPVEGFVFCRAQGAGNTVNLTVQQPGGIFTINNLTTGNPIPADISGIISSVVTVPPGLCQDQNQFEFNFGDIELIPDGSAWAIGYSLPNGTTFELYVCIQDQPNPEFFELQEDYCREDLPIEIFTSIEGGALEIIVPNNTTPIPISGGVISEILSDGTRLPFDQDLLLRYTVNQNGCEGSVEASLRVRNIPSPESIQFNFTTPPEQLPPGTQGFSIDIDQVRPIDPKSQDPDSPTDFEYLWTVAKDGGQRGPGPAFSVNGVDSIANINGDHQILLPDEVDLKLDFQYEQRFAGRNFNLILTIVNGMREPNEPGQLGEPICQVSMLDPAGWVYPRVPQGVDGSDDSGRFNPTDPLPPVTEPIDDGGGTPDPAAFNRRLLKIQSDLETLGEGNSALRNTKPFKLGTLFLTAGAGLGEEEAITRYKELSQSLLNSYKRAGEKRKAELESILSLTTAALMDRMLLADIKPEQEAELKALITAFKEAEIEVTALQQSWNQEELKEMVDAEKLKLVSDLFS